MAHDLTANKKVFIEIDTDEISSAQVRALKSLNHLLTHMMTTIDEQEYFDSSAEAMRVCASLIKQAKFISAFEDDKIPYAEQVLEYSLDVLQEHIGDAKVISYDN